MTKQNPSALLMRLASSDLEPQALHRFALWVERVGPAAFVDTVMHLRRVSEDIVYSKSSSRVRRFIAGPTASTRSSSVSGAAAVKRVEMLLKNELGLSTGVAAELLLSELKGGVGDLPRDSAPRPKESFTRWLTRISRTVSPSQLLHVATRIRNGVLHGVGDWPLRVTS